MCFVKNSERLIWRKGLSLGPGSSTMKGITHSLVLVSFYQWGRQGSENCDNVTGMGFLCPMVGFSVITQSSLLVLREGLDKCLLCSDRIIVQPWFWGIEWEVEKHLVGEWGPSHVLEAPSSMPYICPSFHLHGHHRRQVLLVSCQFKLSHLLKISSYHA